MATLAKNLEKLLENALKQRASEIAAQEIAKAQENIRERVGKEIDKIALGLLTEYEVLHDRQNIVITVKKKN